jgi:hypothetical protein
MVVQEEREKRMLLRKRRERGGEKDFLRRGRGEGAGRIGPF